jgi:Repeat of unknown function (DUF5648)
VVRTLLGIFAYVALACAANAATVRLSHPYGELIDRGPVTAYFDASYPDQIDCTIPSAVARHDRVISITVRRVAPGAPLPQCILPNQASLGELSAGWWSVLLRVLDSFGSDLIEVHADYFRVGRPNTTCGAHPLLRGSVIVEHATLTPSQLADRIARDPAFAARLLDPSQVRPSTSSATLFYGPLDNSNDIREALRATGEFRSVDANGFVCQATPPSDTFGEVVEYVHAGLGHYFYTLDPSEIAGLDSGSGAKGWTRTGKSFRVLVNPGCPIDRRAIAYRFFGKPGVGPGSHFFTIDREECRTVDRSGTWLYEGAPFWATPPGPTGACIHPDETVLYRFWRPFGESSHRFAADGETIREMVAKAWMLEGGTMCVKK